MSTTVFALLAGLVAAAAFGGVAAFAMPALGLPGLAMPLAVGGACGAVGAALARRPDRRRPGLG